MGTLILMVVCFGAGIYAHKYSDKLIGLIKGLVGRIFKEKETQ